MYELNLQANPSNNKGCPFCGNSVEFNSTMAVYNRRIMGRCNGCGMIFIYQEEHEHMQLKHYNGDLPVVTTLKAMRALNAPFERVWNSRMGEESI